MKPLPIKSDSYYYSYGQLLESFEVEVLHRVDDDDYQGDTRVLLRDGDRYGILTFGWGSCSGCDALEACRDYEEVTELRDGLWNRVHWEPSREAMLEYVNDKDWPLEYSWSSKEHRQFVADIKKMLAQENL